MQARAGKSFEKFKDRRRQRFLNEREMQELLNKFLATKTVANKEEFKTLIKLANKVQSKNGIELRALMKLVIAKVSSTIRTYLFQESICADWWAFTKAAEGSIWLCFTEDKCDSTLLRVSGTHEGRTTFKKKKGRESKNSERKKCILHDWGNHEAEECFTFQTEKQMLQMNVLKTDSVH